MKLRGCACSGTRGGRSRPLLLSVVLVLSLGGCQPPPTAPDGSTFVIQACGDTFRVRIDDRDAVRQARLLVGRGPVRIVTGIVRSGDGGFNGPWTWHLDPGTVRFEETTIELCDGCPAWAEMFLGSRFCPWSTAVLAAE